MIVDLEKKNVIATPTKCGTTTLENLARSRGSRLNLLVVRPRQHRMIVPMAFERYTRYLAVRDPYARLVSIYLYLTNPSNYSQWGHHEVVDMSFPQFVRWYVNQRASLRFEDQLIHHRWEDLKWWRSPNLWLVSLGECYRMLRPVGLIRLEHLESDLARTGRKDWGGKMLHSNRSTNRKRDSREMYSRHTAMLANKHLHFDRDCDVLGYEPMEG